VSVPVLFLTGLNSYSLSTSKNKYFYLINFVKSFANNSNLYHFVLQLDKIIYFYAMWYIDDIYLIFYLIALIKSYKLIA